MPALDKILEHLKDGRWHNLKEINKGVGLTEDELEKLMGFFVEYKFVQLDKKRGRAKLTSPILTFLRKTRQINEEAKPSRAS